MLSFSSPIPSCQASSGYTHSFSSSIPSCQASSGYKTNFSSSIPSLLASYGYTLSFSSPIPSLLASYGYITLFFLLYTLAPSFPWVYYTLFLPLYPHAHSFFYNKGYKTDFYFSIPPSATFLPIHRTTKIKRGNASFSSAAFPLLYPLYFLFPLYFLYPLYLLTEVPIPDWW